MGAQTLISALRRFGRRDDGVALVEFAIFLPIFLLAFFVIVEFGRTFFNYQGAVSGVRDATRFAARTLDADICDGQVDGGGSVLAIATGNSDDVFMTIVRSSLFNESGVLPTNIRVRRVVSSYRCVVRPGAYRQAEVPIVRIQARLEITLPLGDVLELNGRPVLDRIVTNIVDESRVFGL
jgi:Flp pilus assembly protein TadG